MHAPPSLRTRHVLLTPPLYPPSHSLRRVLFCMQVVMLFCMGGNFAMFPAQTLREFGANGAARTGQTWAVRRQISGHHRLMRPQLVKARGCRPPPS